MACTEFPDDPGFDNPLDEENPDYVSPETTILSGPADGAVVDTNTVTFVCSGNAQVTEFAYRLDGAAWSAWQSDSTITLTYLNEGDHQFEVKGRYATGDEDATPAAANFTVDDLQGPGFRFSKSYLSISRSASFTINVVLEEVVGVKGFRAEIMYDPARLDFVSFAEYSGGDGLLVQNGGQIVTFAEQDSVAGSITVEMAIALGNESAVSGSGPVATLGFVAMSWGTTTIRFGPNSTLRDVDNAAIAINDTGVSVVNVQ